MKPDIRDGFVFGGLALTAGGIGWWLHPAAALVVLGLALFTLGLRGGK